MGNSVTGDHGGTTWFSGGRPDGIGWIGAFGIACPWPGSGGKGAC
jgi:hypothetical protein